MMIAAADVNPVQHTPVRNKKLLSDGKFDDQCRDVVGLDADAQTVLELVLADDSGCRSDGPGGRWRQDVRGLEE